MRPDPLKLPLAFHPTTMAQAESEASWPADRLASRAALLRDPDGRRLTVAELARRIPQVCPDTIGEVLNGWCRPTLKTGLLLARALGISPWRLLAYSEHMRALRGTSSKRPAAYAHPKRTRADRTARYEEWQRRLAALDRL